ncbi:class I adenylate-forming enzyme family protein [Chengkuizengella sp. SCS-71B]|uniref:class I adenylate-forming enzyme family protein n=1 Tax=Chengkuizengella sp. SCS-71B TaxID=3115290 RepID=UPI0032C23F00
MNDMKTMVDNFVNSIFVHCKTALWSINPKITYKELENIVENNIKFIRQNKIHHDSLVILDTNLGWKLVPILLAFFKCRITVLPFDFKELPEEYASYMLISQSHVDEHGCLSNVEVNNKRQGLNDIALILCTSGSLGKSKAVKLTYNNIMHNVIANAKILNQIDSERFYISRPLYHASAIIAEVLTGLILHKSMYFRERNFTPSSFLQDVKLKELDTIFSTPTIMYQVTKIKKTDKLPVRNIVLSGEIPQYKQIEEISNYFNQSQIINAYGLTEASPRVCINLNVSKENCNNVGKPLENIQLKIKENELYIQGPNIMNGYWNNEDKTNEVKHEGWLRTKDIAIQEEDGSITIMGRKDDLLIRAGVNLHAHTLEEIINSSNSIKESFVYGVNSNKLGQEIVCLLVAKSVDFKVIDMFQYLKARSVPQRFWPDRVKLVKEIPKNKTGKRKRLVWWCQD